MNILLNSVEIRVLGSLIEKEITTPEYYPMSLNALTNACNQKSNRDPVMDLSENEVHAAIETLRDKRLGWQFSSAGARVPKYEHNLRSLFSLSKEEVAVLCVLLLRGPQTIGELRTRTDRMCSFASLEDVEKTVKGLISREDGPFVVELPRQPGRKENRYMHLFGGEIELNQEYPVENQVTEHPKISISSTSERITSLENEIASLKAELNELRTQFLDFKKQLE
jgi:hypothetical protein